MKTKWNRLWRFWELKDGGKEEKPEEKPKFREWQFPVESLDELTRLSDWFQRAEAGADRNAKLKLWQFIFETLPLQGKEDSQLHIYWERVFQVFVREGEPEDWKGKE